jgi:predicted acyl esterase
LAPGVAYQFAIELDPISYVFAARHRIRVAVPGAANDPSLDLAYHGAALNPNDSTVTMFEDAAHAA